MLKSIKSKSFIILFMLGIIITTPLVDAAYLAYTTTDTTNNFNHSTNGQSPDIDSDHYLNRDAQLNYELPKDMNFSGYENSETFPNYNMHSDSIYWGTYLSPNTSVFESYDSSSVRSVEKFYKERWDYQQILANQDTSITTLNFTDADNGTIEFDFLFSDTTEFKIALCQNETEIMYIRLLVGSWRFYTIGSGASGANPGFSVDTWTYAEFRWNRLGNVYFTCRGNQETPLPFGNYSINNIKFEIEDNTDYMLLNGMNASIPKLNSFVYSNANPLIQHYTEDSVFGKDNVLTCLDNDNTSICYVYYDLNDSFQYANISFGVIRNTTNQWEFSFSDGVGAISIFLTGSVIKVSTSLGNIQLQSVLVDTWYQISLNVWYQSELNFDISVDANHYGPFISSSSLQSINEFTIFSTVSEYHYTSSLYIDTEWFFSNETEMEYQKDFKIDTVQDYENSQGWFPTRALSLNSSNHVNITYDSVESWNYDVLHFETVFKIKVNSVFRMVLYNESWNRGVVVEYSDLTNLLIVDTQMAQFNISTQDFDTDYPIWFDFAMIQQYTIVNGTYYDVDISIGSTFGSNITSLQTYSYFPFNFVGKYKFGIEFQSIGYTDVILYAVDSNIILEYFPFSFVSGFMDEGFVERSILVVYKLHVDYYPTFDFTKYKVSSSFNVDYSTGYMFDILDGSQTYKRREVKSRIIHSNIVDSLAIESYQLQNNISFNEDSFSFTTVFNLSLNYTVEIDMGAAKIYLNASEGIQRDGYNVWFNGTTPLSLSNPNYVLPIVYLTVHKTTNHNNGLYYSVVLGSQYFSQSINITSDVSRPIVNFYNYDVDNTNYYSNGAMEIYGMKLTTYDSDFEQYRPKPPTTMAANLEFYNGKWFTPSGLAFTNVFSDSAIITFPNPILSYPLSSNYTIDYSYITELGYISTITVGNVEEYEQTFIESRQGSNKSVYDINSTASELFQYYQFNNFYINYSYLMVYIHPGNISINMVVYHEALWLMYIVDTQLGLLELALGLIVPFILMLIFPYAFYNVFGRNGAVIGFLVGFIVFGIGALISIPAAIIMSLISVFLAIIVYKQYGGNMNYYG